MRRQLFIMLCSCGFVLSTGHASIDQLMGKWINTADSTITITISLKGDHYLACSYLGDKLNGESTCNYKDGEWTVGSAGETFKFERIPGSQQSLDQLVGDWRIKSQPEQCLSVIATNDGYIAYNMTNGHQSEKIFEFRDNMIILEDRKSDIFRRALPGEKPKEGDRIARQAQDSVWQLRQLVTAIRMFASESDGRLPSSDKQSSLQSSLLPYVRNDKVFINPSTNKPYTYNKHLIGKKMSAINKNLAEIPCFYEATPMGDGKRAIAFLDGHVKRVVNDEWARIRKRAGIK